MTWCDEQGPERIPLGLKFVNHMSPNMCCHFITILNGPSNVVLVLKEEVGLLKLISFTLKTCSISLTSSSALSSSPFWPS